MFIGPPKLVFIKTAEGTTQAAIRPVAPKGQTILVAAPTGVETPTVTTVTTPSPTTSGAPSNDDSSEDQPAPRILRRHAAERKYGKRTKTGTKSDEDAKDAEELDSSKFNHFSLISLYLYCTFALLINSLFSLVPLLGKGFPVIFRAITSSCQFTRTCLLNKCNKRNLKKETLKNDNRCFFLFSFLCLTVSC